MRQSFISISNNKQIDMDTLHSGKRITLKRTRPNPLFQTWLEELHIEAKHKKSKLENRLNEALTSISKYPLPLQTGTQCAILNGFDKKLCMFLDKKLEEYNNIQKTKPVSLSCDIEINSKNHSTKPSPGTSPTSVPVEYTSLPNPSTHAQSARIVKAKSPIKNSYRPAMGSGGYALLIALLKHSKNNKKSIDKNSLIEFAQKYTDDSFTVPKQESSDTAWSYIDLLISNGLVNKSNRKTIKYSLTEKGTLMASDFLEKLPVVSTTNHFVPTSAHEGSNPLTPTNLDNSIESGNSFINSSNLESSSNISQTDCIELESSNFDIVLLIDKQENGIKKKDNPTLPSNIHHEYRSLKVGDYTWVAKDKIDGNKELVLPYIVERKRMDDFAASIKDGRFHEQKFRLRRSGIENIIYLVENYGENKNVGLPLQSLMQALANTRMIDNFTVHITKSLTYSIRFLSMMTKRLECRYKNRNLKGWDALPEGNTLMTFKYFNKSSIKNKSLTVKETFIKMLLQLKGVSVEKAVAITNQYTTPRSLINTYRILDEKEGETLLANLKYGNFSRNVGPTVSRTIYQLFSKTTVLNA